MAESIALYSFGDTDRSGKVRWTAAELGLEVDEQRVGFGAHFKPPYAELNPLKQIPTVVFRDDTLIESTAICHELVERTSSPKLWIGPAEPRRREYLFWLAAFGETLEGRLVECAVSKIGILPPAYFELHEKSCRRKLAVLAERLPKEGYLCGEFSLADIVAGYNLRLAIQSDLLERSAVDAYLGRLIERPGAKASRIFDSL